jgi:hypothetical protein
MKGAALSDKYFRVVLVVKWSQNSHFQTVHHTCACNNEEVPCRPAFWFFGARRGIFAQKCMAFARRGVEFSAI